MSDLPPPTPGEPQVSPAVGPTAPPAERPLLAYGALAGSALLVLGSFLDWAKVQTVFGSLSVSGMEGDGKFTAAAGVVAAILFAVGMNQGKAAAFVAGAVVSLAALALSVWDYSDVTSRIDEIDEEFARASVGIGLYLCIFGAGVAMVCGFMAANNARQDTAGAAS